MMEGLIKITSGEHTNEDAIDNAIKYIYRLDKEPVALPILCYGGICYPPTYESLINEFRIVRENNNNAPDHQIWHFILSFKNLAIDAQAYWQSADAIALMLGRKYQVAFSYQTHNGHPHFHFIVSATSYNPDEGPLFGKEISEVYLPQITYIA